VGLLKTAATVAVASSVHGRVQRRQQARWAAQEPAPAGVPPAAPPQYAAPPQPQPAYVEPMPAAQAPNAPANGVGTSDRLAQLKQLGDLLSAGVLTQAEFDQEKARILKG
jgi:Short C-terminal domain